MEGETVIVKYFISNKIKSYLIDFLYLRFNSFLSQILGCILSESQVFV